MAAVAPDGATVVGGFLLPAYHVAVHTLRFAATRDVLALRLVSKAHAALVAAPDVVEVLGERFTQQLPSLDHCSPATCRLAATLAKVASAAAASPFRGFVARAHIVPLPLPPGGGVDGALESRYNSNYVCRVTAVVAHCTADVLTLTVCYAVTGDNSLGSLQSPLGSRLVSESGLGSQDRPWAAADRTTGSCVHGLPSSSHTGALRFRWEAPLLDGTSLSFVYGSSGYSAAPVVPNAGKLEELVVRVAAAVPSVFRRAARPSAPTWPRPPTLAFVLD